VEDPKLSLPPEKILFVYVSDGPILKFKGHYHIQINGDWLTVSKKVFGGNGNVWKTVEAMYFYKPIRCFIQDYDPAIHDS
jgi:hypothetical protein